jgi:hypothetical protein
MPHIQHATQPSLATVFTPVSDATAYEAPGVGEAQEERRSFTDRSGRYWRIEERRAPAAAWVRGPRYLLFECATIARRVWTVPSNWRVMTVTELEALSEQR